VFLLNQVRVVECTGVLSGVAGNSSVTALSSSAFGSLPSICLSLSLTDARDGE
jgi:hypothetical protein